MSGSRPAEVYSEHCKQRLGMSSRDRRRETAYVTAMRETIEAFAHSHKDGFTAAEVVDAMRARGLIVEKGEAVPAGKLDQRDVNRWIRAGDLGAQLTFWRESGELTMDVMTRRYRVTATWRGGSREGGEGSEGREGTSVRPQAGEKGGKGERGKGGKGERGL